MSMSSRIQFGCLIAIVSCLGLQASAQSLFGSGTKSISPFYRNGVIGISLNHDQSQRHDFFSYNSMTFNQEQVVSMYQEDGNQDMIYFVSPDGVTQYISYGPTSPMNLNQLFAPKRDSFNPYGVKNPIEGVITGVLNLVYNRRLDLFRNRKKISGRLN